MSVSKEQLARLVAVDQGLISDCMMRLDLSGWTDGVRLINQAEPRFIGTARTVLFGPKRGADKFDRGMYSIVESLNPGDVLVVAGGGTEENLVGDNVVAYAQHHKLAGIVVDARVRDLSGMLRLSIPIFSRGITARMHATLTPVAVDVPVSFAGAQVRPGDVMLGGIDGLVVLPPSRVADVLYQLDEVADAEAEMQRLIAQGARASEIEAALTKKKTLRP